MRLFLVFVIRSFESDYRHTRSAELYMFVFDRSDPGGSFDKALYFISESTGAFSMDDPYGAHVKHDRIVNEFHDDLQSVIHSFSTDIDLWLEGQFPFGESRILDYCGGP